MSFLLLNFQEEGDFHDDATPQQLDDMQRLILFIGGIVGVITNFFLILGSMRFKELRQQPGDIILGIAISDLLISAHWIVVAVMTLNMDDEMFCQITAATGVFGGALKTIYNIAFSIFLITSLKNALTQSNIPRKAFHIISLTLGFLFLSSLYVMDVLGHNASGTCSISTKKIPAAGSYVVAACPTVVYTVTGLYTYCYVKQNSPTCIRSHVKRTKFLLYYCKYNIACIFLYISITTLNILTFLISTSKDVRNQYNWIDTLYSLVKVCSPVILTLFRCNDPTIKRYMWKTLICRSNNDEPTSGHLLADSISESTNDEEINRTRRESSINPKDFFFKRLSFNRKVELTYTFLSCVIYSRKLAEVGENVSMVQQTKNRLPKNSFRNEKVFQLEEEGLFFDLPLMKKELGKTQYNILPGTLKIYAPEVFNEIIKLDRDSQNIMASLDFTSNRNTIRESCHAKSGKSGQFFFFSKDKRLVMKTVTDEELNMLLNILQLYHSHFKAYPESLIAKIYGAYTYETTDFGLKFNLIVMKNICGISSKYVERIYDLKGSTYGRQVLNKTGSITDSGLKRVVLKDIDFEKHEQSLYLKSSTRDAFVEQIKADSRFFRSVNLIDYSFMVYIVDKKRAREEGQLNYEHSESRIQLNSMENTNKGGLYYNVGIIDYLQAYNFGKACERCFKRTRRLNPRLDTSSQDPEFYSDRFIDFIKKVAI